MAQNSTHLPPDAELRSLITSTPELEHTSSNFMHGRLFSALRKDESSLTSPPVYPNTKRTSRKPRDDHSVPEWLTATEFGDLEREIDIKSSHFASLLLMSRRTVLYTGAGISASVIGQAARSSVNKQGWVGNGLHAQPTKTHLLLSQLVRAGLIHSWIQQNHDGLPQKAGCPQGAINEIHGSWFDPSNPVVKYSGNLKTNLYACMRNESKNADLVIALGTSLSGLNADQMVVNCAKRKNALGSIMINLQQTQLDGMMTLRIFGTTDDVLTRVLKHIAQKATDDPRLPRVTSLAAYQREHKVGSFRGPIKFPRKALVPYDKHGYRLKSEGGAWLDLENPDKSGWTMFDLSLGARVKLHKEHNVAGAQQPAFYPIVDKIGMVGDFVPESRSVMIMFPGRAVSLGEWWIEAAMKGTVDMLPVVNV